MISRHEPMEMAVITKDWMAAIFLRSQLLSFPDCAFESGVLWRKQKKFLKAVPVEK
ncbi:hypothetical protein [Cytobacillus firmus]|uniref:hypothetical protein n=1 Tax=Cytobacillus firmus TaxID=1399 RepID=UPI0024955BAA|nr:hypothetical protein [Cytobacillus firmus]